LSASNGSPTASQNLVKSLSAIELNRMPALYIASVSLSLLSSFQRFAALGKPSTNWLASTSMISSLGSFSSLFSLTLLKVSVS